MQAPLLRTVCHDWHVAHGGRMVEFSGWKMPVQYSTITKEHNAVRDAAGLFDIAHMGRLRFTGPDACRFLDVIVTNDVTNLQVGQIRYALVTNSDGGILDDVLVYRFDGFYFLVVNASNRQKIVSWIDQHRHSFDVDVEDLTFEQFMLALQGPNAIAILKSLVDCEIDALRYYHSVQSSFLDTPALVSRNGYTGEIGFEVIVSAEIAQQFWETLIDRGRSHGLLPAGLGCRDTLRLDAAMPLYGHELNESIDPFTAGLSFAVKLDAGDFIGKEALIVARENKNRQRRIGLELSGRRIAREGAILFVGDQQVGEVTSGTFSPTFERPIAMAYVKPAFTELGTMLQVDIRGKREQAIVVKLPFYRRQ